MKLKYLDYLQKISFKGGSHLGNLKPTFFLASPISGMRFLLRVVVYNIPRFYQILGEFFCLYFRDFYFRALGSLVVLSFPQPLKFSSVFPSL
jgi:hypothetical protein